MDAVTVGGVAGRGPRWDADGPPRAGVGSSGGLAATPEAALVGPRFFPGLHQPADAGKHARLARAFLSINRVRGRRKPLPGRHVLDSGAFRELEEFGDYRHDSAEYARELRRLHEGGIVDVEIAVAQDYMCEQFMCARTLGMPVRDLPRGGPARQRALDDMLPPERWRERIVDHQRMTVERYDALLAEAPPMPVMPVLQGYAAADYVRHVRDYGDRLGPGQWVGVGSVCKRNGDPVAIVAVLGAIKRERPDLRLHGFGLKTTSLLDPHIRSLLHSADSMAWSYAARMQGRDGNDWREAVAFAERIGRTLATPFRPYQLPLLLDGA